MDINFGQGASPLGLPYTRARAPLRRRAPIAWLARDARSRSLRPAAQPLAQIGAPGLERLDERLDAALLVFRLRLGLAERLADFPLERAHAIPQSPRHAVDAVQQIAHRRDASRALANVGEAVHVLVEPLHAVDREMRALQHVEGAPVDRAD